jgi:hypothetical protein
MAAGSTTRLILVEGLPGAGKTTLARKFAALRVQGWEVALYLEGDLHPCELQWISRMDQSTYNDAVEHLHQHWLRTARSEPWESILANLERCSLMEDGFVLTVYTKLDFADSELWGAMGLFRSFTTCGPLITPGRIREAAAERGNWLDGLVAYITGSPYGQDRGLKGFEGAMAFFDHRAGIERAAMKQLGLPMHIVTR